MNKNIFIIVLALLLVLSLLNAETQTLGTFKQNDCINLIQTCSNCSYVNISSVLYPNSSQALGESQMTKQGTIYNYTFCSTSALGNYVVNGHGNLDGEDTIWSYNLDVTNNGERIEGNWIVGIIIGLAIIAGLLFYVSTLFNKENFWIKFLFILFGLGMLILTSQSIHLGSTSSITNMITTTSTIVLTILFIFILSYLMIIATKDVLDKFKNAKKRRLEVKYGSSLS